MIYEAQITPYSINDYIDIYIKGIEQTLVSEVAYNNYICQKKEQQYIAVGTVRMFIEPSACSVNPFPV